MIFQHECGGTITLRFRHFTEDEEEKEKDSRREEEIVVEEKVSKFFQVLWTIYSYKLTKAKNALDKIRPVCTKGILNCVYNNVKSLVFIKESFIKYVLSDRGREG